MKPHIPNKRRGIAIESALILLVTVFALCTLLTTLALTSDNYQKTNARNLEWRAEVDAIGDRFVSALANLPIGETELSIGETEGYKTDIWNNDSGLWTLSVYDTDEHLLLTVKAEKKSDGSANGTTKIVSWNRSSLPVTEADTQTTE